MSGTTIPSFSASAFAARACFLCKQKVVENTMNLADTFHVEAIPYTATSAKFNIFVCCHV